MRRIEPQAGRASRMFRLTQRLSERTLRALGLALVAVTAFGVLANIAISALIGDLANSSEQAFLLVPFIVVLVWMFRAVPGNAAVWAVAWGAALGGLGDTASTLLFWRTGLQLDEVASGGWQGSPADLDFVSALALNIASWSWLGVFLISVHFVLLFPSGSISSRRWLYVSRASSVVFVMGVIITAVALNPWRGAATSGLFDQGVFWAAGTASALLSAASIAAMVSLILRFRRSTGEERFQYRWVVSGFSFWLVTLLGFGWFSDFPLYSVLYVISLASIPVSIGIAITKHRLYDIDVVLSRTLVYGALAMFIGAVYVGIVVGVGSLVGSTGTWLQITATVVIAIAFQTVRRWLQRLANRVVFGRKVTPYEVLSSFSKRVSSVDPAVLTDVARSLVDGTTAESASIWVHRKQDRYCIAAWPEPPDSPPDGSAVTEPVVYEGEELGWVALEVPPGQTFPPNDQRLFAQVAGGLGLALRNLFLTADLKDRVEELAASRRRIVRLQDETRRKLERDLHDGAQQRLVSLKIKLGIGASMAERAELVDLEAMLDDLRTSTDDTIESVRDFARGIYPPLLEAEGLESALRAQTQKMPIAARIETSQIRRYPKDQESIVYFCVLEALQNALKHSEASSLLVQINEEEGDLTFEVRDDGVGFDVLGAERNGLMNMTDRVEAVGGVLEVQSAPGEGTVVRGSLPVREVVST